ncbi:F-box only protein 6-like protein [Tanacetum coccineum]
MLRQLVTQSQDLYGTSTSFVPPVESPNRRWCLLNLEDNPSEDDCYNLIMRSGKFKLLEPGKAPPSKRARKDRTRGKLAEKSTSAETMDEEIWKEFPEDLYEAVIARLPVTTFFRFRKWHHPTVPAVPTKMIILPVASAGGLVCFLDIGHRSFYVCNPLTRSFRELQARSVKVWSRVAVGMTINEKSRSYQIMWVGSDGEYEVYNSIKNTWTCPGRMPACIKLPLSLNFRSQPVTVDGSMYFLRSDPDGIVSYDMETGVWKQFTKMTLLWKEVDRMPNIWCLEFYGKHIKMSCLGNRGLLMLSLRSKMMNRLVTYDILRKEWLKVPNCVLPHSRKRQWIACGTAFHPCLTAKA